MKRHIAALLGSAALLGACHDATGVPDLNNVSSETLQGALTTASAQLLVTGLLNQYRNSATGNYVVFPETMARDALRIDKAETRYLTEMIGNVAPDNGAFTGQGIFAAFFVGIRSANTLIDATTAATDASGMDATQRASLVGLGQTIKALNYWNVIESRDSIGMPIDLDHAHHRSAGAVDLQAGRAGVHLGAARQRGDVARREQRDVPRHAAVWVPGACRYAGCLPQVQPRNQGQDRAVPRPEPAGWHRYRRIQCRCRGARCVVHGVDRSLGRRLVTGRVRELQHRVG